ncbi:MAG: hypothetical protein GDA36_03870 [Rhodobacteraceae bacterium]|nr:hypothetical protein [Paracoccaceae bacterium]
MLSNIDVLLIDWRRVFADMQPTCKRALGCAGIGPQGYVLVRFNCLLNAQCTPKLARAPSTAVGFHAVLRSRALCACARCDDPLPFSQCAGAGRFPR